MSEEQQAFSYQAPDELVYNLFTGRGDQFGLLPTVADYYRSQFEQLGEADTNPFTYTGERIAGFSPREELAMQLADQGIGSFQPFLSRAGGLSEEALATLAGGTSEAKSQLLRALQQGEDYTRFGIDEGAEFTGAGVDKASEAERGLLNALSGVRSRGEEGYQSGLANILQGTREGRSTLQRAESAARQATDIQQPFLQEALGRTRASTAGFDTADIDRFQNPFEDAVVQQTIQDLEKARAQGDIAARAQDISSGAFGGSRARLGASERDTAAQRGLAEALAGIRAGGFTSSRDAAMSEFARQRAAEAGAAAQTAGLGAQAGSAQAGLAQSLANLGQQRFAIGTGAGSQQAGLGAQSAAAQLAAAQAGQGAKQATAATLGQAGQQLFGMGTGAGQQLFSMGSGAGQQLSGLAGQLAGGQQQGAQAMTGLAQLTPQLRAGDVQSLMNVGAMNRARNQAGLDLNYQNFVGQYNMPQQLASGFANFLTGAGPLAGGFGYSGPTQQTPFGTTSAYGSFGMSEGGATEKAKEGPRGGINTPFQVLKLLGFEQETIDDLAMQAGDMPKGLVDLIIKYGQKARDAGIIEEPEKKETGGSTLPNKGLAALAKKAPEVVRRMGFQVPEKKRAGGIVNSRFPMSSRKMGA